MEGAGLGCLVFFNFIIYIYIHIIFFKRRRIAKCCAKPKTVFSNVLFLIMVLPIKELAW